MDLEYMNTGHAPTAFRLIKLPVFFSDESCLDIIEKVLDEKGAIINFPGYFDDERWKTKQKIGLFQDVRHEAQFHNMNNGTYLMLWLTQPSGWNWIDDDGFGFSGDSSIMLYSVLDENGNFLKQFKLFSIDHERCTHDFDEYL